MIFYFFTTTATPHHEQPPQLPLKTMERAIAASPIEELKKLPPKTRPDSPIPTTKQKTSPITSITKKELWALMKKNTQTSKKTQGTSKHQISQ